VICLFREADLESRPTLACQFGVITVYNSNIIATDDERSEFYTCANVGYTVGL